MIEKYLIEHCSPTLASLKTASLFNYEYDGEESLEQSLKVWNKHFENKGIELTVLRKRNKRALIYVCRKNRLQKAISEPEVANFLEKYGYEKALEKDVDAVIEMLTEHVQSSSEFPHEIGVFLGYPIGDVKGFIENSGKCSKCVGCWKVYCNECEALKTFARYKKCKDVYMRLWQEGRSIDKLTVVS